MPTIDHAALREVQALILDLKDEIIGRLLKNEKLTTEEIYRVQGMIAKLDATGVAGQLHEVLTKYGSWAYKNGVEKIDAFLAGEGLAKTLALPQSSIDLAAGYIGDQIKTIPANLLADVSKQITLGYLGQRTPQEIMRRVSDRFNVSLSRAETIVRTETKKLQNFGSEARIREAADGGKKLGLKSLRYWIHSSGSPLPGDGEEAYAKGKYRVAYDPRPHHKAMHGTAVEVDAKFHLVNRETRESWFIDGPHDPALPAGEVVNCYCDRALRIDRESVELLPQPKKKGADPAAHEPIAARPGESPETDPILAQRTPQAAAMAAAGFATGGVITRDPFTGASLVRDPAAVPEPPAPRAPHSPKPVARRASAPQAPAVPVVPDSPAALGTPWGKPLDEAKLRGIDLHTAEASWSVPKGSWWSKRSYGAVMIDDDGRILMREPKGNFGGYAWTFPKGGLSHAKEHPLDAALREVGEETGYGGQVMGVVPGTFKGDTTRTNFFLMRPGAHNPATMDGETSALRWVSPAEAKALIMQSKNKKGRTRDLAILEAALEEHELIKSGQQTYAHLFGEGAAPVQPVAPASRVPSSGFPSSTEGLKVVRNLGGSTGAQLVEDPATGKRYVMKRGANPDHLLEEAHADAAYQALGVKVPSFKMYTKDGAPVKLAEYVPEARTLAEVLRSGNQHEIDQVVRQLGDNFVADALLGNWDVVGLSYDNILVDKAGTAWRIDNGGSLRFRAQGARKKPEDFTEDVTELGTMRLKQINESAGRVFSGVTDDDIARQIERLAGKKQDLLAALPAELRPAVEARLRTLEKRISPSWFSESEIEAIADARVLGRTFLSDSENIEDNSVLIWQEMRGGKPIIKARLKLTKAAGDKLPAHIAGKYVPPENKGNDAYWPTVLLAVKTINTHQADGQYNQQSLEAVWNLKKKLKKLKTGGSQSQEDMKEYYLDVISQLEQAVANKTATGMISQFVGRPPKPLPGVSPDEVTVSSEKWILRKKDRTRGYAIDSNEGIYEIDGALKIVTSDGVVMRHVPVNGTNSYALRGMVELELEGAVSREALQKLLGSVKHLGVDPRPSTKADLDLAYVAKHVALLNGQMTREQRKEWQEILTGDEAAEVKAEQLRSWAKSNVKLDIPKGVDLAGQTNAYGYGWKSWYRGDITPEQIERQMKGYVLVHKTSTPLPDLIESLLNGGGQMTNSTERLRIGIPITDGMSPHADIETGGAEYFFTRITTAGSQWGELEFKIRNLARLDAWSFPGDRYGDVRNGADNTGQRQDADVMRKTTVDEFKTISKNAGNETIFKHGLNFLDDIQTIRTKNPTQRKTLIRIFKKHGYTTLPDGRKIEEVVV